MTGDDFRSSSDAAAALTRRAGQSIPSSPERSLDRAVEALRDLADGDDAAQARAARAWQRQVDQASATWLGTLLELAEAGDQVLVTSDRGTTFAGVVEAVGRDVVVLRTSAQEQTICVSDTLTSIRALHRDTPASGDRESADINLQGLLSAHAEDRCEVVVHLRGSTSEPISGVLSSCGEDVCSIRTREPNGVDRGRVPMVHVRLGAIASVTIER